MATTATPKIAGKAIYLELVADPNMEEAEVRNLLGWQYGGVKQLIIFPQYQDDTGEIYDPVVMERIVSSYRPRSQWDMNRVASRTKPIDPNAEGGYANYVNLERYTKDEWDSLTEREKYESRKQDLEVMLRNLMLDSTWVGEGDEKHLVGKQGWVVRDSKPFSVEVTTQDLDELYGHKTPQAVIRRINKVRDSLDKFPKKLA